MAHFVPPVPPTPPRPVGFRDFLRATRTNAIGIFSELSYTEWSVTGRQASRTTVVLNAPDAIHHVLVANPENYRRTPTSVRILYPIVGDGLLLSEGDAWRHQRRTIAPALAPRTLPLLARHIVRAGDEAMAALRARAGQGPVDLQYAMQHLALDIAARSMFSFEMKRHGPTLRGYLMQYGERLARPGLFDLFLLARFLSPNDLLRQRFRRQWLRFIGSLVDARLAQKPRDPAQDLLDLLRNARDPETGEGFSREALCDQTATMIVAGHETTANTLFWALYLIANDPEVQSRLHDEVAAVAITPDNATEALARLPHTKAVINEALRLFPPAFVLVRQAVAPDIAAGIEIPANAAVMISPWVLHRHRKLWTDPATFDPDRFLGPPPRFAYLPFGAGPRICVGAQFALTEAAIVLAQFVRAFEVAMGDDRPVLPVPVITTVPDHAPPFLLTPRTRTLAQAA